MAWAHISATRRWLMQGRACSLYSLRIFSLGGAHLSSLIRGTFHACTALCLWGHLFYRVYSAVFGGTCATVSTLHCVYCGTCATVCTVLCLWWHLCYRVYNTVIMMAPVLPCVQHCVYGGTCATLCTALCLWWHLCYCV